MSPIDIPTLPGHLPKPEFSRPIGTCDDGPRYVGNIKQPRWQ